MIIELAIGTAGSLLANAISSSFKRIKSEEIEIKEGTKIQLIKELVSARNTLQYFAMYYRDLNAEFLEGNSEDEEFFLSLLMERKDRIEINSGGNNVSSYCSSIFELYESFETALYATDIFWDGEYFDTKVIITQFDEVRYLKVQYDLGEAIEHDTLFEISYDLLNIYNLIEDLLISFEYMEK